MSNLYFNIDDININETDKIDFKLKVDSEHYKYDYIKEHNQLQIPLDKFEPLLTIFKKYYNKEKITSLEFIEYLNDFNIYLKKYNLFSIKTEDFKTKVSSMDLIESTKENYKIKDNEIGEVNFTIEKSKRINQRINLNIKKWQVVFNEYNELNKIANRILNNIYFYNNKYDYNKIKNYIIDDNMTFYLDSKDIIIAIPNSNKKIFNYNSYSLPIDLDFILYNSINDKMKNNLNNEIYEYWSNHYKVIKTINGIDINNLDNYKKINSLIEETNDKRNNNETVDIIYYSKDELKDKFNKTIQKTLNSFKENTIKTKNNQLSTIQNKRKLKTIFPSKKSLISLTDNLKEIEKYIKNNKNDKIYIKNILQILKMYKISIPTYLKQEKNIKKERER